MNESKAKGFTLIECVVSMVLVVICFSAVYGLLTICVRTEVISREIREANSLARLKLEYLKVSTRTPGGSLTGDTAGYFDNPHPRYTRRWRISDDPMGSQTVVVVMVPNTSGDALPEIELVTRMY